ncbi:MAG: type IX secretion system membrane protein PorP/SprF, partial [Bacteroidales bacterium]|nr:type IX secretion system membrane protein PorP/SprF [Bacteroidales bacterium]
MDGCYQILRYLFGGSGRPCVQKQHAARAVTLSFTKSLDRRNRNKLGFGFYGGFVQRTVNYAALYFDEQYVNGSFNFNNPVSETFGHDKLYFFDCGIGAFYSYAPSERFSLATGISASHLNLPDQS